MNDLELIDSSSPLSVLDVRRQVNLIQELMRDIMQEGVHYGKIPGCGDKPTLLQPGAQKLCLTFQFVFDCEYSIMPMDNGHREVRTKVFLYRRGLDGTEKGQFLGVGVGTCSTMEGKYRYRKADQVCPSCGKETIIKGRKEYGGGWLCFQRRGGCGAKFKDGDASIENQNMGRVEHDNPADYYNTVEKMSFKRALVHASINVTAASDIFSQDLEDMTEVIGRSSQAFDAEKASAREENRHVYEKMCESSQSDAHQRTQTPAHDPSSNSAPVLTMTLANAQQQLRLCEMVTEAASIMNQWTSEEHTQEDNIAMRRTFEETKMRLAKKMKGRS